MKKRSRAFFEKHEKLHLLRKDDYRIARQSSEVAEIYYHEHRIKHFNLLIDVLYYILTLCNRFSAQAERMTYIHSRLVKLLIDKCMTKTEMCKSVGISTSILVKMGKGELISTESLTNIATAL